VYILKYFGQKWHCLMNKRLERFQWVGYSAEYLNLSETILES
jgi:hypothetical protein